MDSDDDRVVLLCTLSELRTSSFVPSALPKPSVLIYVEPLLGGSMTFVRAQAEALTSFCPYYISPQYFRDGLSLPTDRVLVMRRGEGRLSALTAIPFKMFGVAPLFVRRLQKLCPSLLHAHFGHMGIRALPLARKLGIPLVVTFHGGDATVYDEFARASDSYALRVYTRQRKVLGNEAALLIAVSNFIRAEMITQGFSPSNIVVHYIGVDIEEFSPDSDVRRQSVVLFTGRLEEKKGCEYLIRAMAKVQSNLPNVELVVIGDGSLRIGLERTAAETLGKYRFLGSQPPDVVRYWMNRARVFAAPSIRARSGDAEGFGIVFAEAQAMKLPVVSFASGGFRKLSHMGIPVS